MKDLTKYSPQLNQFQAVRNIKIYASFYPNACYEFIYGLRYIDS